MKNIKLWINWIVLLLEENFAAWRPWDVELASVVMVCSLHTEGSVWQGTIITSYHSTCNVSFNFRNKQLTGDGSRSWI
jgi:hypothetical protein